MSSLKGIERAGRRMLIGAIISAMQRRTRIDEPVPQWGDGPHRVLFLRHDRIGDMVVTTGLLRAIAESHPQITLDVLASPENAPVLKHAAYVNDVLVLDRWQPWTYPAMTRRMRAARYDAVIDPMPAAPSSTTLLLMLASGARHRIGVAGRGIESALTIPVPKRVGAVHIIDDLSALGAPFGVDIATTDWHPKIPLAPDELARAEQTWRELANGSGGRRVLVNVSAGKDFRLWPDANFVESIHHIRTREPDATILVVGAPSEAERVAAIASAAGASPVRTPSLLDAFALVATAQFILTPDTSIAHAAAAFRIPTVALYSRGYRPRWGLYDSPGICLSSPEHQLSALPVAAVVKAIEELARNEERGTDEGRGTRD